MKYWISAVNWNEDDYKRAEGFSEIIGIFKEKELAQKAAMKEEYSKNADYLIDDDVGNFFVILTDQTTNPKESKIFYKTLFESLETVDFTNPQITKEFMKEWEQAREGCLGNPEFTLYSSGYRHSVYEKELIIDI